MNKLKVATVMLSLIVGSAQCFAVSSERADRKFNAQMFENVGLRVFLPLAPAWQYEFDAQPITDAIVLSTPPLYFPATQMSIKLHPEYLVTRDELPLAAIAFFNATRKQLNLKPIKSVKQIQYVEYGVIKGYVDLFNKKQDNKVYSVENLFGVMPSEQPIVSLVSTPRGQLEHVEHIVMRVWRNLRVLPSSLPQS